MTEKSKTGACPECTGKGFIACPACHGQGRQPSSTAMQRPCMSCHGKGTAVCPVCRGTKRAIADKT